MSDGQSHGERLVRVTPSVTDAGREQDDMTQAWKWPVPPKVRRDAQAPMFRPLVDLVAADAEERQRQRDHELAMAEVENESALVEARVRLAAAWQAFDVWTLAAICSLASAVLTGMAVAAALR